MLDNADKGGWRALVGFYYQMLGTLGIMTLTSQHEADPTSLLATINVDHDTLFLPECLGQDLVIASGETKCLIQFKHTGTYPGTTIDKADMWEIINSFRVSLLKAEKAGVQREAINGCILITNRSLVGEAKIIRQWAQNCQDTCGISATELAAKSVDLNEIRHLLSKVNGPTLEEVISSEIQAEFENIEATSGKQKRLTEAVNATLYVLSRLYVRDVSAHAFEKKIEEFALSHGADMSELDAATDNLLMDVWKKSIAGTSISITRFLKALTGSSNAKPLTPEGIGGKCKEAWDNWKKEQQAGASWLLGRDISSIISKIQQHKVVFLTGDGGCGKTEMLTALAGDSAAHADTFAHFEGFPVLTQSKMLRSEWLERTIGGWAERSEASLKGIELRLRAANPKAPTILLICVDGLDEDLPDASFIRYLYDMTQQDEGVRLLITSRSESAERLVRQVFPGGATGSWNSSRAYEFEQVEPFTAEEVRTAATNVFGDILSDMFEGTIQSAKSFSTNVLRSSPADPDILDSLRHPRMFGAFASLQNDPEGAREFLEGRTAAIQKVASIFLSKFFEKYLQRHSRPSEAHFDLGWHAEAYKDIASQTRGADRYTYALWKNIIMQDDRQIQVGADGLYKEAATGGLIIAAGKEWYWRHSFVTDRLADDSTFSYLQGSET